MTAREWLEDEVRRNKVERQEVDELKCGTGKCIVYQDLIKHPDCTVYQAGKILLEKGSTIGLHGHQLDSETWTVIEGKIECNNKILTAGQTVKCSLGKKHYAVNLNDGESVIRFVKR